MSTLHLIRLSIDLAKLGRWAASRNYGWTDRKTRRGVIRDVTFDEGRALHHLLSETFGKGRLQPFRLIAAPGGAMGQLYAYTSADKAALTEEAGMVALPDALEVCDLSGIADKPMPAEWRSGRQVGFEVRVRPIQRLLRPLGPPGPDAFAAGAEVDAFLVEAMRQFPDGPAEADPLRRENVYTQWLAARLRGAATLQPGTRLVRFARQRVSRAGAASEGPDATLQGDLVIADPLRFQDILGRGIGRHRAYGFGMLMLRPATAR